LKTALVTLWALASSGALGAQTVDDVVARYIEARGGLSRLHAVQSLRLVGRMSLPDVAAPFVLELKRGSKMRTEFTVQGRKGIQAFDGRSGWSVAPLPGEPPRPLDPDTEREARAQADVDLSPLVDSKAKGFTVELVGRERLSGGDTWKLLVRGGDQPDRTLYLDTRSHLVVRAEEIRDLDGQDVVFVTEIGDYRTVEGLVYPHRIDVGPKEHPEGRQRLEIETIEINPPLDDSRFQRPGER
jgi:hypothetical protein